jgi:WD40 repeat protein
VLSNQIGRVQRIAFSPDGKLLACPSIDGSLGLWEIATGKLKLSLPTRRVDALCFPPNGKTVLTAHNWSVLIDDPVLGKTVQRFETLFKTWDITTGAEIKQVRIGEGSTIDFSPDGQLLATCMWRDRTAYNSDFTVYLWDVATGKAVASLKGHSEYVSSIAFSPDGKLVATAALELKLWDRSTWKEVPLADKPLPGGVLAFSPDSKLLAVAGSVKGTNKVQIVDGKLLIAGPSALNIWDLTAKKEIRSMKRLDPQSHYYTCAVFSPDGKTLAVGWSWPTAQLWDVATGELKRELPVLKIAFTPLGQVINLSDRPIPKGQVKELAFTPDGKKLVTARTDGSLELWDLAKRP